MLSSKDRRFSLRRPVRWAGRLDGNGSLEDCLVLDIGRAGALIQSSEFLPPGARLKLKLHAKREIPAVVVWQTDHFMGVKFQNHVADQDIA